MCFSEKLEIIINNNTGNTITLTPITLTVEEALDQSFTDLTNFYQYVTIEGEFYWDYQTSYPSFSILSDESFDRQIDLAHIYDFALQSTLESLDNEYVAVTGYLLSYYTLGSVDWVFIYESHQIITE